MYTLFAPGVFEALQHFGIAAAIFILYAKYKGYRMPRRVRYEYSCSVIPVSTIDEYGKEEMRRCNKRRIYRT
jgi:hypothetical protein